MTRNASLKAASDAFGAHAPALRDAGIERLIVFGSVARGEDDPHSDIDILVIPASATPVGGLTLARWRALLSDITGRAAGAVVEEFLHGPARAAVAAEGVEVFRCKTDRRHPAEAIRARVPREY